KVTSLVAAAGVKTRAGSVAEAARFGEVVVLATPFDATEAAIRQAGDLAGRVVIDCTNPLKPDLSSLSVGHTSSGAEAVARWAKSARVVKTLNSTGAGNMANPVYGGERATMFVCGDDAAAKTTAGELVSALGFDVVDAGPLAQASGCRSARPGADARAARDALDLARRPPGPRAEHRVPADAPRLTRLRHGD